MPRGGSEAVRTYSQVSLTSDAVVLLAEWICWENSRTGSTGCNTGWLLGFVCAHSLPPLTAGATFVINASMLRWTLCES